MNEVLYLMLRDELNVNQKLREQMTLSVSKNLGSNNKAQTIRGIHIFVKETKCLQIVKWKELTGE